MRTNLNANLDTDLNTDLDLDKRIMRRMNSATNLIVARFLIAVCINIILVTLLTLSGVFVTKPGEMFILLGAGAPSALFSVLIILRQSMLDDARTKYVLCALMCCQAFAVALAGYSYTGTISLLLPVFLAALYPKSKMSGIVSLLMILTGLIMPPLALYLGFWDGDYYEFLYDLSFARYMDTATLSDELMSLSEQLLSAVRFCSSQNLIIIGGFSLIGLRIYHQTNRSFDSQREIIRLSERDELTGLLNRNCFERRLNETPVSGSRSTICFYFDLNGLHEVNNELGHKAGDTMLQFVGHRIQDAFGANNTFRIGGDEYVAFSEERSLPDLDAVRATLEQAFASQGYHVAIGYAQNSLITNLNELVQLAEKDMYQAKREYYKFNGDRHH